MKIENRHYVMELDDRTGSLLSLRRDGKALIVAGAPRPVFTIRFRDVAGVIHDIDAHDAQIVAVEAGNPEAITMKYTRFAELPIRVSVSVFVRCPEDSPHTYWRIEVEHEPEWIIEWIDFPDVVVPNDLTATGGSGKLVWPFAEGVLIDDVSIRENSWFKYAEPKYPNTGLDGIYPGIVQSQFMAYYDDQAGLYMGAHDACGHVKGIEFYGVPDGIRLQFRFYPGGSAYEMTYDMVLGVFEGDWHDAADIYRDWYRIAGGNRAAPIARNERFPDWYGDSPVVVTYPVRGRNAKDVDVMDPNKLFPYVNAMPHIERLAEAFDSRILVLLMHWEGSAPWAPPYVWPPYGGEEALKAFTDRLHESGHLLGVYCSGIGWTEQSKLVEAYNKKEQFDRDNLADVMCLSPEGDLPYSAICPNQRVGYDLCPSRPFTVDTMVGEVRQMIAADIDYVQAFDQNNGGTSYFCYSKSHGHPPAPGKWQTDAMIGLFRKLREAADEAGKKVLIGCESGAAEPFIPELLFNDARFNLNYFFGTPIPLYAYLYHEYINNFMGNQVATNGAFDHGNSPDNLLYRLAYSFIAGDMSTVVLTEDGEVNWNWGAGLGQLPDQTAVLSLIRNMNRWRKGEGKPYLHEGRMRKPAPVSGIAEHVFRMHGERIFAVPAVLTSRWEAPDGRIAQIFVNFTREEQAFALETGADSGRTALLLDDPRSARATELRSDSAGRIPCTVRPLSAILIRFPAMAR